MSGIPKPLRLSCNWMGLLMARMEHSIPGNKFCKTAGCPASETLLRYHRRRLPIGDRGPIESHLRSCDFCPAELQLLTRHRTGAEEYRLAEMPTSLRRLAEDLLARGSSKLTRIAELTERHQLSH